MKDVTPDWFDLAAVRSLQFRSSRYGQFCLAWEAIGMAHATSSATADADMATMSRLTAVSIATLHYRCRMLELANEWHAYGILA